jgi:hypothetical protein
VSGAKRWKVFPSPFVELPVTDWGEARLSAARPKLGAPVLDVVLRPGDAVYIPRGFVHVATCVGVDGGPGSGSESGDPAVHVTVGFMSAKIADAILEALRWLMFADYQKNLWYDVSLWRLELADQLRMVGPTDGSEISSMGAPAQVGARDGRDPPADEAAAERVQTEGKRDALATVRRRLARRVPDTVDLRRAIAAPCGSKRECLTPTEPAFHAFSVELIVSIAGTPLGLAMDVATARGLDQPVVLETLFKEALRWHYASVQAALSTPLQVSLETIRPITHKLARAVQPTQWAKQSEIAS